MQITIQNLDILVKNFHKAPNVITEEMSKTLQNSSERVWKEMKNQAPYGKNGTGTGELRKSIRIDYNKMGSVIYPTAHFAKYVERGRGPVVAGPGKILPIKIGQGTVIFRPRAKAAPANPFVKRTYDKTKQMVVDNFNKSAERIIKQLGFK